jgi:hypothetical protein
MGIMQNIHLSESVTETVEHNKYDRVITTIFDCVNEHLLILMSHMLASADDKLHEKAQQVKSDTEKKKFTDCAAIFCNQKGAINQQFFITLNHTLSLRTDDTELSPLVYQDEMDELVAITTMHAKGMRHYGEEVNHMEARLEYLELLCDHMFDKEALDPRHICQIFQKTIEEINISGDIKLIFYKIFDQEVCSKLGVMYKTINEIFVRNNILPEIVLKTTKEEEIEFIEQDVCTRVASYYDPTEKVHTDFIPRTKDEMSKIVNEFMTGEMTITGDEIDLPKSFLRTPTRQDLTGRNCYERREVIKALSQLQRTLTTLDKLTTQDIKEQLLSKIHQDGGEQKRVNLLHERSIDFVGLMFDAIDADDTINGLIKSLLKKLQIPVTKVAMVDDSLYQNDQHPARLTLDLLSKAGNGISSHRDRLYGDLEIIVNQLIGEWDIDLEAFEYAASKLSELIQREDNLSLKNEFTQQQKILRDHARNIVVTQIKMVSYNRKIPVAIKPLILKHWSSLMFSQYINYGRNSDQWKKSVTTLKLLLKCVQPIRFNSQYRLLRDSHLGLVEAVNDALYQTKQNREDVNRQITALETHLGTLLNKCDFARDDNTNDNVTGDSSEAINDNREDEFRLQQQLDAAAAKIALLDKSNKPGVWYEIFNGSDKPVRRLKLSVILEDVACLVFVDRKGNTVIEKDAEIFARELESGRSRMLADHSAFDNALGSVIGAFAA